MLIISIKKKYISIPATLFDHLKVKPGKDVKDIYSFGNFLAIDYKVLIAFQADKSTIDSIISKKELKLSTEAHDHGLTFGKEFHW